MSDKMFNLGNFEMLRAMYDFKATYSKTLSFIENEHFILHQTNPKQRNWWQVINEKGDMGFVPSNYVTSVKVNPQYYVKFLTNCIETLRAESSKSGISSDKHELILRLTDKKRQAEVATHAKGKAPQPPDFSSGSSAGGDTAPPLGNNSEDDIKLIKQPVTYSSPKSYKPGGDYITSGYNKNIQFSNADIEEEPIKPVDKHFRTDSQQISDESSSVNDFNSDVNIQTVSANNIEVKTDKSIYTMKVTPSTRISKSTGDIGESNKTSPNVEIGPKLVYELVETVRKNTQLSHEMSRVAVATVVKGLEELFPTQFGQYFKNILSHVQGPLAAPEPLINQTHDATRLKVIFTELTSCKEDSQQRSWMLHEDETIIKEYILELISILSNADAIISKHVMSNDQYSGVISLIQYYQMEIRWSIRQLLLQAFGVMCSLDNTVVNIMLNSVLPMELARDMRANPRNIPRLNYSALLLTMIFSMGERMPITHLEQLGVDFIIFLFKLIESPPDTDADDQIPDLFLNLILAYNLQFTDGEENIVLQALKTLGEAKILTEKILLLLNREEDPVRIFDHQPAPEHSVLKLFVDLFFDTNTASLFYTNDTKVLIDITVRQLSDISAGDPRRHQYLELCRRVMRNTNYGDHCHRRDDILKCFTRIFCEESEISQSDQKLVREISNEFPQFFKP